MIPNVDLSKRRLSKREPNNNKTSTTGTVIRSIFQQELRKFENRFEAKMDIKLENLGRRVDFKLENLERRVDERARQYRDEVLTSNDKLAKKLETMEQESVVGNFQRDQKLEDHEKRVRIIESSQKS